MKFVVFGLTVSSSWGNGHATLWRGLMRSLTELGHSITFFERDVAYYAENRDLWELWDGAELVLYSDWQHIAAKAVRETSAADVAIVTSYCPDGRDAAELVLEHAPSARLFYDLDTPVTLAKLEAGEQVPYLPEDGLGDFDLVLSYTGGGALDALERRLGAKRTAPLYGHVDPHWHTPAPNEPWYSADLSYLGTYAADRQDSVEQLLIEPARKLRDCRFLVGGSAYPDDIAWPVNVRKLDHIPPSHHPSFFSSSRLSLNVTRGEMARMGWCPSGRLFEAAACGAAMISDEWAGLDAFFTPGEEVLVAGNSQDVVNALELTDPELTAIGNRARLRVLDEHTSMHRARELVALIEGRNAKRPVQRNCGGRGMWGVIPAAGNGTQIQPLAFSKELLPVGGRLDERTERPKAVSEYLVERMACAGATKICFVISPGKSDIVEYYGPGRAAGAEVAFVVQPEAVGLCDAIFRAHSVIPDDEPVMVGLPDTIWFPQNALAALPDDKLSFLLFPVEQPQFFDAVVTDEHDRVTEIQVKSENAKSKWIWGAFKMPGRVFHELRGFWSRRPEPDEYIGTLVNAWLSEGGEAVAVRAGTSYVDVGTLDGYRSAMQALQADAEPVAAE